MQGHFCLAMPSLVDWLKLATFFFLFFLLVYLVREMPPTQGHCSACLPHKGIEVHGYDKFDKVKSQLCVATSTALSGLALI